MNVETFGVAGLFLAAVGLVAWMELQFRRGADADLE